MLVDSWGPGQTGRAKIEPPSPPPLFVVLFGSFGLEYQFDPSKDPKTSAQVFKPL